MHHCLRGMDAPAGRWTVATPQVTNSESHSLKIIVKSLLTDLLTSTIISTKQSRDHRVYQQPAVTPRDRCGHNQRLCCHTQGPCCHTQEPYGHTQEHNLKKHDIGLWILGFFPLNLGYFNAF